MFNYLEQARAEHVTYTEALAQAHNSLVELAKNPNPTNEDFKTFDTLEKQIKALYTEIAIECMKNEGYTINKSTQMWEKH